MILSLNIISANDTIATGAFSFNSSFVEGVRILSHKNDNDFLQNCKISDECLQDTGYTCITEYKPPISTRSMDIELTIRDVRDVRVGIEKK